jgi:hypothetical protein
MKNAGGFYTSSLEMLLDTMCNMLGGIVFIALMVALMVQDTPAPPPTYYQSQALELSNQLAAVTASNAMTQAELQKTLLRLQNPHLHPATNVMRLPNITDTSKLPWTVIVQYGKLYPLDFLSTNGPSRLARNNRSLSHQGHFVEPRPALGDDPERGVTDMAQTFKDSDNTNFYFAFWVYDDSFDAFVRARETAAHLGFEYGWEPLPHNERLQLGPQGEHVLPQN